MGCVYQYANPVHAFTYIYALLKFICVFAYISCVYFSLYRYGKKNLPHRWVDMKKKIKMALIPKNERILGSKKRDDTTDCCCRPLSSFTAGTHPIIPHGGMIMMSHAELVIRLRYKWSSRGATRPRGVSPIL